MKRISTMLFAATLTFVAGIAHANSSSPTHAYAGQNVIADNMTTHSKLSDAQKQTLSEAIDLMRDGEQHKNAGELIEAAKKLKAFNAQKMRISVRDEKGAEVVLDASKLLDEADKFAGNDDRLKAQVRLVRADTPELPPGTTHCDCTIDKFCDSKGRCYTMTVCVCQ